MLGDNLIKTIFDFIDNVQGIFISTAPPRKAALDWAMEQ
jgi:hypothetical protein